MTLELHIKAKALHLGFDAVGITTAEPVESTQAAYFQAWLADGNAGQMDYMHRNIKKRFDPAKLLTGAKSVICVALNYRSKVAQASCLSRKDPTLRIANFAQYEDYHPFMKDRLFQLAEFIQNETKAQNGSERIKFKACVDSVPIAERALAQRAGLGFIGKNHMLINPELGNQILLGELITTLELEPDEPMTDVPCGDCGKCIRACPTGALGFDGTFDARKCISYLTIESPLRKLSPCQGGGGCGKNHPGLRPPLLQKEGSFGGYIFGCDECILACPHELGKPPRQNIEFRHHPEWQDLTPEQIQNMTEEQFQKTFANSGFIRLGLERLKRNSAAAQDRR